MSYALYGCARVWLVLAAYDPDWQEPLINRSHPGVQTVLAEQNMRKATDLRSSTYNQLLPERMVHTFTLSHVRLSAADMYASH